MDTESLTYMEHVKKKKPRKFVMIVKGIEVLQLVVFKKGQYNTVLQKALKNGPKGPGRYWGIAQGEGVEVAFRMAIEDGFETDPVKVKTLKSYLKEHTGTPFKPRFEFVSQAELEEALRLSESDDDDDASPTTPATPSATQPAPPPEATVQGTPTEAEQAPQEQQATETAAAAAAQPAEEEPAQAPEPDPLAEQQNLRDSLQQQFDALGARLQAAAAAHPEEAEDLHDLASEFDESLRINDLVVAGEWLEKLRDALDDLPDAPSDQPVQAESGEQPPPPQPPAVDPLQTQFETRLKAVAPVAVPRAKAGGEQGQALAELLRAAQGQRAAGDFAAGLVTLDQIDHHLAQGQATQPTAAQPPTPPHSQPDQAASPSDDGAAFKQRVQTLMPQLKAAIAAGGETGTQIKSLVGDAQAAAKQQDFATGEQHLDQIERLLSAEGASADRAAVDPYQEVYQGLLATIPGDLHRLQQSRPDAATAIQQTVDQAAEQAAQQNFQHGAELLNRAAEALATALAAAATAEAREVIPEGTVARMREALAGARSRWDEAIVDAKARLVPVKQRVAQEYPDSAAALDRIIDSYWQDLVETISQYQGIGEEAQVAQAQEAVISTVNELRQEVMQDELFGYLDECGTQITPVFHLVFDDLESLLTA
jgi:hypothetical protein